MGGTLVASLWLHIIYIIVRYSAWGLLAKPGLSPDAFWVAAATVEGDGTWRLELVLARHGQATSTGRRHRMHQGLLSCFCLIQIDLSDDVRVGVCIIPLLGSPLYALHVWPRHSHRSRRQVGGRGRCGQCSPHIL